MTQHRVIIAAGPSDIRRLCCGSGKDSGRDSDIATAALDAIDDAVALVDERPVAVASLWSTVLRPLARGHSSGLPGGAIVVHPSWWSASRVGVVTAAARTLGPAVQIRPRSWLLARVAADCQLESMVLVEIADRLVVVTGPNTEPGTDAEVVAVPRRGEQHAVAAEVARLIATKMQASAVLIDVPGTVAAATPLASSIAGALGSDAQPAIMIDDAGLERLARAVTATAEQPNEPPSAPARRRPWVRAVARFAAASVVLMLLAAAIPTVAGQESRRAPIAQPATPTVLVEGRVALRIPAGWIAERVIVGPGSARVQVTSPADAEVALHVTQSPTPGETLAGAADRLKRAIEAEPAGVFIDFNPFGVSAGRPAVTYREVRAAHDVQWTVLLDGAVRISVGCQSRPGARDAVRAACEEAVRSAHALD